MPGSCLFRDKQGKQKYISLCRQDFMGTAFWCCWERTNKQTNLIYLWDGFFFDIMRQTGLHRIIESCRTVVLQDNLGQHGLRRSLVWLTAQSRVSCVVRLRCSGLNPMEPGNLGTTSLGLALLPDCSHGKKAFRLLPEVMVMVNALPENCLVLLNQQLSLMLYLILQ